MIKIINSFSLGIHFVSQKVENDRVFNSFSMNVEVLHFLPKRECIFKAFSVGVEDDVKTNKVKFIRVK